MNLFARLFGSRSRPAVRDTADRSSGSQRFRCVEILPAADSCEAVRALEGQRILNAEAPLLPLPECDRIDDCSCRYRHFRDRRATVRRDADLGIGHSIQRRVPDRRSSSGGRRIGDRSRE